MQNADGSTQDGICLPSCGREVHWDLYWSTKIDPLNTVSMNPCMVLIFILAFRQHSGCRGCDLRSIASIIDVN